MAARAHVGSQRQSTTRVLRLSRSSRRRTPFAGSASRTNTWTAILKWSVVDGKPGRQRVYENGALAAEGTVAELPYPSVTPLSCRARSSGTAGVLACTTLPRSSLSGGECSRGRLRSQKSASVTTQSVTEGNLSFLPQRFLIFRYNNLPQILPPCLSHWF